MVTAPDTKVTKLYITDGFTVGSDGNGADVTFYSNTAGVPFYWDSTNGKLGLGTIEAIGKAHIKGGNGGNANPTVVLQSDSSTDAWSLLEFYGGTFDTTNEYMIGRGNTYLYSGRALTIHIPDLNSGFYGGIGENPKIAFVSSGSEIMGYIESGTKNWYMAGNVGIGTNIFGSSADKVLGIANGVEPTASVTDAIQLFSTDLSAGNTTLGIYTEGTGIVGTGTPVANRTIAIKINGTVYYLIASTSAT